MPSPTLATAGGGRETPLPWIAVLAAAALAVAAIAVVTRRRRAEPSTADVVDEPLSIAAPAPVPRARLAVSLRPRRAGLNLLSATSENDILVSNVGDAAASDIRVQARLFAAHDGQAAELAAWHAEPPGRPVVAPFTLAPGESRPVPAVVALPRQSIRSLDAGGRPMFVPIVAIDIVYGGGEGGSAGRLAQAFAIGIERVDTAKLAPFWLDTPPRSFDQVAARPQSPTIDR